MDDSFYRTKFTLLFSIIMNTGYSLLMLVQGIRLSDMWSIVMALYYAALTGMRSVLIRIAWKDSFGTDTARELQRSRLCGILMLLLDIVLTGVIAGYMRQSERAIYPIWQICTMAAFAFYKMVVAIISTIKSRETNSPAFSSLKWISLCAAIAAMLSLECSMLNTFGNDEVFRAKMISISGIVAFIVILCISIRMMVVSRNNRSPIRK